MDARLPLWQLQDNCEQQRDTGRKVEGKCREGAGEDNATCPPGVNDTIAISHAT